MIKLVDLEVPGGNRVLPSLFRPILMLILLIYAAKILILLVNFVIQE